MSEKFFNPQKIDLKAKKEMVQETRGPENTIYDIAPVLSLKEAKADVSYIWRGHKNKREADIYQDQNGNTWYEIKKLPRNQMMISLLSQKFFNISTVIEVPQKEIRGVSKFLATINPKLANLYNKIADNIGKSSPSFLSKNLNLDNVEQKSYAEMMSDFLVFENIFDSFGHGDRDFTEGHNVKRYMNGYAFFDFDHSRILPLKHFEETKKDYSAKGYFPYLKNMITLDGEFKFRGSRIDDVLSAMNFAGKKLEEIQEFFKEQDGEKFVQAVLDKTKCKEEYKEYRKKVFKEDTVDESYFDAHELAQGILIQIPYNLNIILKELKEKKDIFMEADENKKEALKKYEAVVFAIEEILNKINSD
jgi:hypothetical protein